MRVRVTKADGSTETFGGADRVSPWSDVMNFSTDGESCALSISVAGDDGSIKLHSFMSGQWLKAELLASDHDQ